MTSAEERAAQRTGRKFPACPTNLTGRKSQSQFLYGPHANNSSTELKLGSLEDQSGFFQTHALSQEREQTASPTQVPSIFHMTD